MAKPPYPSQGSALPEATGYRGQWVIEDRVFIFQADQPGALGEFVGLPGPDGTPCDGFDIDLLADLLKLTPEELLDCNRRGLLMVESKDVHAEPGVGTATEFQFKTPHTGVGLGIFREAQPAG